MGTFKKLFGISRPLFHLMITFLSFLASCLSSDATYGVLDSGNRGS